MFQALWLQTCRNLERLYLYVHSPLDHPIIKLDLSRVFRPPDTLTLGPVCAVAPLQSVADLQRAIKAREALLVPVFTQVAHAFADLHDTPGRMLAKGCIHRVVHWRSARRELFLRLRRRLVGALCCCAVRCVWCGSVWCGGCCAVLCGVVRWCCAVLCGVVWCGAVPTPSGAACNCMRCICMFCNCMRCNCLPGGGQLLSPCAPSRAPSDRDPGVWGVCSRHPRDV